jgi:2-C-methyl-D-erythritol 4-phosphate cytidylyltransferase
LVGEQSGAVAVVVVANLVPVQAVIGNTTAVERVLSTLVQLPDVKDVLVAPLVEIADDASAEFGSSVRWCVPQTTRLDAIRTALHAATASATVLLHDADQPLIPPQCLTDVLAGTANHVAVAGGTPVKAAFKQVVDGVIEETVPRHRLIRLVGPRAFRREVLLDILRSADAGRWPCDDELRAARLAGVPVAVHRITNVNIRVVDAISSNLAGRLATDW